MKTKTQRLTKTGWISAATLTVLLAATFLPSATLIGAQNKVAVQPQIAARIDKAAAALSGEKQIQQPLAKQAAGTLPHAVTVSTYPFMDTTGVALEDMSSGTTQLVAAGSDDGSSGLVNIGFDFWYDGVRFTQFAASANGYVRLGAAISASSPWVNALGSTTDAPKIMPYLDDLWEEQTGKYISRLSEARRAENSLLNGRT